METLSKYAENPAEATQNISSQITHPRTGRSRRRIGLFLLIGLINVGLLMLLASQLLTRTSQKAPL